MLLIDAFDKFNECSMVNLMVGMGEEAMETREQICCNLNQKNPADAFVWGLYLNRLKLLFAVQCSICLCSMTWGHLSHLMIVGTVLLVAG